MKTNIPEEETLTPIVRDIEKLFQKLFKGFSNLLKNLGLLIGKLVKSWKKLAMISFLGGIIGASTLLFIPREYASNLVLKTHINANEQLFNDIEYLNALIESNKYDKISEILEIPKEKVRTIKSFEVTSTATITERLSHLDKVYSRLDSNLKKNLNIENLLENDKYTFTNTFKVTIYSNNPFVFEGIESNFISYLERVPQLNRLKENKLAILYMQKDLYERQIKGLDSLKSILNNVMTEQAKTKGSSEMTINMGQSGQNDLINPLEIYAQINSYTQKIVEIEEQIPLYENCYFVVSHLNETGHKSGLGGLLRAVIGAVFFGLIASIIVMTTPIKRL